jgi:anaerobic magnesium-protoporphyrin IX monomethyl ester cyclase
MKILFVVKSMMMETLGPMYLSAVVKASGNECKIIDISRAEAIAIEWMPDIIGYSILTGNQKTFKELDERLKSKLTFLSVAGNAHPSFFPEDCDWADMIISGEAEQAVAGLLQSGWKFPDINSFPWPDRSDYPSMEIRDFITSRGCPQKCSYCFNERWAKFPGQKGVRTRSVNDVVAEIKQVNPKYAFFQDSCFGVSMKWMREFAEKFKNLNIPYQCNFRPEQITEERAKLLKDSHCVAVRMALETASDRLRAMVGRKGYTLADVKNASNILTKYGIQYMIQNITGLPESTIEDDLETLAFNVQCQPTYAWVSIYQPYKGTALGDLCKEKGYYEGDYSDITDSFFDTSFLNFTNDHKEQLEVLQKIFALCVQLKYIPKPEELTHENLPKLIHTIMRKDGDRRLYLGYL